MARLRSFPATVVPERKKWTSGSSRSASFGLWSSMLNGPRTCPNVSSTPSTTWWYSGATSDLPPIALILVMLLPLPRPTPAPAQVTVDVPTSRRRSQVDAASSGGVYHGAWPDLGPDHSRPGAGGAAWAGDEPPRYEIGHAE